MAGCVTSVNVGGPRPVRFRGRTVTTAIWKAPVEGPVAVRGVNLAGDDQADRRVHGGVDKAVYVYAEEDLAWWSGELERRLAPGVFGENLTVSGVAVTAALVGERWRVGSALLEVCQPRTPCYKLGIRMDDAGFPRRFARAGRPGAYLRILDEGEVRGGDVVDVVHRPAHGVTVGDVAFTYQHDHGQAGRLLDAPELAGTWINWARSAARARGRRP